MSSIEHIFATFQTSPSGLTSIEAKKRLIRYGKNVLKEETTSKWRILGRQFNSPLIYILFVASIISFSIQEFTDFSLIAGIIALNGLIGFWQEIKAETSIAALKKLTESHNKVIRDGHLISIPSSQIVPGDFLIFHEGEIVTCDVRLAESAGLMADESSLTGESAPVSKDHTAIVEETAPPFEQKNRLLAGTTIVRGTGKGVAIATGSKTYFATIAEKAQEASPSTPLTQSLAHFTKRYVILLLILFSFLGAFGYFQERSFVELGYILLVSLVSAVPEGLPLVLTLVMVVGAISLSKKKTIIRYLPSVETLGSASIIASDKTGTITEGKLIVKEVFSSDLEKLKHIAALCNDTHEGTGDPLDVALSRWVENFDELRKQYPRKWAYSFDTRLMLMATTNEINGKEELLVKGAYESLKERAEHLDPNLEAALQTFLQQGLRVLAFGYGPFHGENPSHWKIKLVGLVGFLDPPKPEVAESVASAKRAGIRVLMITGDHPMTAREVAREVGICSRSDTPLTGKEIEAFSDEQLFQALQQTTVLARALPEHKYRVVKLLQTHKEIVAVTGDGVNDVPALKAADLGIAMGGGTEAAKSVAKMVITDNNLKVIVGAIHNARVIADNIRKVIYYLISTSLQEITLLSIAIFSAFPLPLSAIQILWINLVTGGVQDKLFIFAKEEGNVMRRKPFKLEKKFFNFTQIAHIFIFGLSVGSIIFLLYLWLLPRYPFTTVSTLIFTSVASAQWANGIQAQKEREPFFQNLLHSLTINPLIFLSTLVGLLLQILALYAFPAWFHAAPIPLTLWRYPLYAFFAAFAIVELRKWIERLFIKQH